MCACMHDCAFPRLCLQEGKGNLGSPALEVFLKPGPDGSLLQQPVSLIGSVPALPPTDAQGTGAQRKMVMSFLFDFVCIVRWQWVTFNGRSQLLELARVLAPAQQETKGKKWISAQKEEQM